MPMPELSPGLKAIFATAEPPGLGPEHRPGTLTEPAVNEAVRVALAKQHLRGESAELIRGLALLWHDHLEAAHAIAQGIENPHGAWLHAIMHRREPDYWNSKYWLRRAGAPPCFAELAGRAGGALRQRGQEKLASRLLRNGEWDAFALVDAVEVACAGGIAAERDALREVQGIELRVLLEWLAVK